MKTFILITVLLIGPIFSNDDKTLLLYGIGSTMIITIGIVSIFYHTKKKPDKESSDELQTKINNINELLILGNKNEKEKLFVIAYFYYSECIEETENFIVNDLSCNGYTACGLLKYSCEIKLNEIKDKTWE